MVVEGDEPSRLYWSGPGWDGFAHRDLRIGDRHQGSRPARDSHGRPTEAGQALNGGVVPRTASPTLRQRYEIPCGFSNRLVSVLAPETKTLASVATPIVQFRYRFYRRLSGLPCRSIGLRERIEPAEIVVGDSSVEPIV
jgi:hypothetical protein